MGAAVLRSDDAAVWGRFLGRGSVQSDRAENFVSGRRLQSQASNDVAENIADQSWSHVSSSSSLRPQISGEREMDASGSTPRNTRNQRNEIRTQLAKALQEHVPLRVVPAKEITRHVESSVDTIDTRRQGQIPAAWAEMIEWCRAYPGFGLEVLDLMGIDIDQDPRAFAKFLELKNLVNGGAK